MPVSRDEEINMSLNKNSVLDAWIWVEQLTEGDFDNKGEMLKDYVAEGFFKSFQKNLLAKRYKRPNNSGFVVFLGIFEFDSVIELICKQCGKDRTEERDSYRKKFSLALFFDNNIRFLQDKTFFTASGYVNERKSMPTYEQFRIFENEEKQRISNIFEKCYIPIDDIDNENKRVIVDHRAFDEAMAEMLRHFNNRYDIDQCRVQYFEDIENDCTMLHSFFIDDLQTAKHVTDSKNLDKYLFGSTTDVRQNLDSNNRVESFSKYRLEDILQPKNYPLGRYPSNTDYPLYLMQQVAVNLSTGYDRNQLRSVNGPPGTGKTTLLKDIIAELIVEQAYDICRLSQKRIDGRSSGVKYDDKWYIGRLPEQIAEKNILIASSNNSAVKNIVNELPKASKIDHELLKELLDSDYFSSIASSINESNEEEKQERFEKTKDENMWGLISLEGGGLTSKNMAHLIRCVDNVYEEARNQNETDDNIFRDFEIEYERVKKNAIEFI